MGWDNDTPGFIGGSTYQIAAGDTLTGTFHILSQYEREQRLLWTMIVDGMQVEFTVEGEETLLFPTHLGPGEETSFAFETPPLAEGFHNITFICFLDYDNHGPESDGRRMLMFPSALSNVWSGDVVPVPTAAPNPSLQRDNAIASGCGIWLSQDRFESASDAKNRLQWTAEPGERLDYFTHTTGSEREAATGIALIAFLDYHQVPLQVGDPVRPLVSLIAPGEQGVAACRLIVPQEEGPHELQVARIDSIDRPFSTITQTDQAGRYRSFSVLTSQRVLLEVRPGG